MSRHWLLVTWRSDTVYLFLYQLSGHRPAQRECAGTGLTVHARCHPYPVPQPLKVGHIKEIYEPYSFRIVLWVLLRPKRTNPWKCYETGPTVFLPYPRRLESLTICRCHYKGSTFFWVIWIPWVLVRPGFEPATSRSADRCSPNWATQAAVDVRCSKRLCLSSPILLITLSMPYHGRSTIGCCVISQWYPESNRFH